MSEQKRIEINIPNLEDAALYLSIAVVIMTFVIAPLIYFHKKNVLISNVNNNSCYSKVLVESWRSDAAEIMALQTCQKNEEKENVL